MVTKGFREAILIKWHDSFYGNACKQIPTLVVAKGTRFHLIYLVADIKYDLLMLLS